MNRQDAETLHRLLAGGLHVATPGEPGTEGLHLQDAALRVAAAQLRAIRFALATDRDTEQPEPVDGRQGWDFGDSFGKADAIIALGGVMAVLDNIHHVARDVERALEQPMAEEARQ